MGKRLTPEERGERLQAKLDKAASRWQTRADKLRDATPKSFKGAMRKVHAMSRLEIARVVYSEGKPGHRAGMLKAGEVIEFVGDNEALLKNTARSDWKGTKTYYAWIVAYGHDALDKGKKYYAWMVDPRQPRPQTLNTWLTARLLGAARMQHKIRALKGRPWRQRAIALASQRGTIIGELRKATREAMGDADKITD